MHDGGAQSLPDIPLRYVAGVVRQAGALAWLPETSPTRFVIVTSRRTGRWILPKGSIDDGRSEVEIAAEEAWEEAGLSGDILPPMIGLYHTPKIRPPLIWTVEVALYPLRVSRVHSVWPEQADRRRRMVTLSEAGKLLSEPDMTALMAQFASKMENGC